MTMADQDSLLHGADLNKALNPHQISSLGPFLKNLQRVMHSLRKQGTTTELEVAGWREGKWQASRAM